MSENILSEMPGLVSQEDRYFIRRTVKPPDYEEAYWNVVVDPDGNVRDRLAERERFLANLKHEVEFLRSLPSGRILDIGCGPGFLLSALEGGWQRHGVEVSAFAAKHAAQWGEIFVGEVEAARYPDAWFDAIVMHHVIEHIPEPGGTIREVHRVLKPGGVLLLGTPDFDSGCARLFGERYRLLNDPTHVSLFSNDSMHRFLRDHGFLVEKVDYPFFDTPYFTPGNLERLFDRLSISPPFYGNFMTFYCRKPDRGPAYFALREQSRATVEMANRFGEQIDRAVELLRSGRVYLWTDNACGHMAEPFVSAGATAIGDGAGSMLGEGVLLAIANDAGAVRDLLARARRQRCATVVVGQGAPEPEAADVWIGIDTGSALTRHSIQILLVSYLSASLNSSRECSAAA